MDITREQIRRVGVVGLVVLAAAGIIYAVHRRFMLQAAGGGGWTDSGQPPDGIAAELSTLSPQQSWAANRCSNMSASCTGQGAGRRLRRTYPSTLAECDTDPVQAQVGFIFEAGI